MHLLEAIRTRLLHGPAQWVAVAVLLLTVLGVPRSATADSTAATSREYEIKAAFLYNFAKFIEWPPESFPDANAPIVIGILGDSPCKPALEQLAKDHRINGRTIVVRKVDTVEEARATHLLFVGKGQEVPFERLEPAIAALPIVTVGESTAFVSAGGAINFVLQGDNMRFEINIGSTDRAGVKISAQLLKLATTVRRS